MKNNRTNTSNINVECRIWLNIGNESFLGQGKIELMVKIKEYGSLSKAAAEMKMSYRKAWGSINRMNDLAGKPLVILKRGGKDGGIAEVTEAGEKIILLFKKLQEDVTESLRKQPKSFEF